MIKAIVWDFDGVIVDSEPLHYRAFLAVAQTLGVSFTWDEYLDTYIGYDDRDAFRVMQGSPPGTSPGEDQDALAKLCDDKAVAFERAVAEGVTAIPGSAELIRAAYGKLPMAISSGATRADIDLMLAALNLADCFELIVSADDVTQSKPHPASYTQAVIALAQKHPDLHLTPADCLAIEDTAAGITSATDAGLATLALMTTARTRSALHHANRIVDTLEGSTLDTLHSWYTD